MGFVRVEMGKNLLGIEGEVASATPGSFTVNNFPCGEDGTDCDGNTQFFNDPATDIGAIQRRLVGHAQPVKNIRG
jgi:cathepsin X